MTLRASTILNKLTKPNGIKTRNNTNQKNNNNMKAQKITLPIGIVTYIVERSKISAAISNLNSAKKYISEWLRNAKDCPNESNLACLDYAIQWGLKYANEFYAVEHLANTYKELWQEKYSKAKLTYEKTLHNAETLLDNHKKREH